MNSNSIKRGRSSARKSLAERKEENKEEALRSLRKKSRKMKNEYDDTSSSSENAQIPWRKTEMEDEDAFEEKLWAVVEKRKRNSKRKKFVTILVTLVLNDVQHKMSPNKDMATIGDREEG